MKRLAYAIGLLLMAQGTAWAKCPDGQVLKPVGSAATAQAVITTQGADVAFISGVCTGTACTVTLYDGDKISPADASNLVDGFVKFETGAAASTAFVHDLTDSPVRFLDGVVVAPGGTDNLQGIVLLQCAAP